MTRKTKVETGSGNIFADLGLPDAETHFLKAQIVSEIYRLANLKFHLDTIAALGCFVEINVYPINW